MNSSSPQQPEDYNTLTLPVFATWNGDVDTKILLSEKEVLRYAKEGKVTLDEQSIVINMSQIVWPEDSFLLKKIKQ